MAVATTTTPAGNSGQLYVVTSAAEIQDAMATAQPGDTLLMTLNGNWVDADIKFRGFGTAAAPITLKSESSTEPVVLSGASRLRMSGSYLVASGLKFHDGALTKSGDQVIQFRTSSSELADHCRLTNTAIVNYNPSDSAFDYRWVGLYGTHNRVDHCYFSGKNNQGPLLIVWRRSDGTADHHTVVRNYFGNFASGISSNGLETIRIGVSATSLSDSSSVVSNNLFERCNGEAEIISVKSGDNVLKGNTFDSCEGSLTLRHGRGNTVDGNFFLGKGARLTGGVRIIDSDHTVINNYFEGLRGMKERAAVSFTNGLVDSPLNGYHVAKRATVAFNTFYDCKEAFRLGAKSSNNPVAVEDCVVANNAVFTDKGTGSGASTIVYEEDPPTNMKYDGNYMHGEGGVVLGISPTAGIDEADPVLTNVDVQGLHRPDAASPCVAGAVGEYADPTDMDGQSRPSSGKDVGADQVSGDAVTSKPLSATDVGTSIGPSWMLYSSAS